MNRTESLHRSMQFSQLLLSVAVGIGATLAMDLWAVVLKYTLNVRPTNYCLVGRWLGHMPAGVFSHSSIEAAAPKPFECVVGWLTHYVIGIIYALVLVLLASPQWLREPTLLPALGLGLATVVFPFFVMQPAFGLGMAASKTPRPAPARVRSLLNHAVFGLGLYLAALIFG